MAGPDKLIEALCRGDAFGLSAEAVELIETHISWVLLAGQFAYKIKKPVVLPFLDYSTLEKRRQCCHAELTLNRRFAPNIYLDVVAIGGSEQQPQVGAEPALEWAVKMRRFDAAQRLDNVCRRGELNAKLLRGLAQRFVAFQQDNAAVNAEWGDPESIAATAIENFTELRALLPAALQPQVAALAAWTEAEFARCRTVFASRRSHVREGHGDLHMGNLVLIDGKVFPFDCIEFNDGFRWIDVANDIAFLWMDLVDHGRADLAGHWLNAWLEFSGDFGALKVLRFYAVYRAMVRAKVAAIRGAQGGETTGDESVANYLELAQRLAVPSSPTFARPPLMITCGLSGSGKTHRSAAWLAADPDGRCIRLRSDVERKRLFGLAPLQSSASAIGDGLYSAEANTRTYTHLLAQADAVLELGYPVIVDAAFLRHTERKAFRQLALRHQLGFGILYIEASDEVLQVRIRRRQHDASEATLEVLARQKRWFEPLTAEELGYCQPLPAAD